MFESTASAFASECLKPGYKYTVLKLEQVVVIKFYPFPFSKNGEGSDAQRGVTR